MGLITLVQGVTNTWHSSTSEPKSEMQICHLAELASVVIWGSNTSIVLLPNFSPLVLQASRGDPARTSLQVSEEHRVVQPLRGPHFAAQLLHRLHEAEQQPHGAMQPAQLSAAATAVQQPGPAVDDGPHAVVGDVVVSVHALPRSSAADPGRVGGGLRAKVPVPVGRGQRVPDASNRAALALPLGVSQRSRQRPEHSLQSGPAAIAPSFHHDPALAGAFLLPLEHELIQGRSAPRRTWCQRQRFQAKVKKLFETSCSVSMILFSP